MEMDQPRQPIISRLDLSVFEMVRKGLADTSTVGWDNAHMSIELATKVYNRPEAKRFLHQFLHQITGIMLDQVFHYTRRKELAATPVCVGAFTSAAEAAMATATRLNQGNVVPGTQQYRNKPFRAPPRETVP